MKRPSVYERIEAKLDKLDARIDSIDITLAEQHVSLKEHVRRTNLLEAKLQPVEKHVAMVTGALKLIGLLGIISGILELIITIIRH